MRRTALVTAALLALVLGQPLLAADKAWEDCEAADPDQSIAGCTLVLKRGTREKATRRVDAYTNRGISYGQKKDYDRAIADYDEALRLDPRNSKAY